MGDAHGRAPRCTILRARYVAGRGSGCDYATCSLTIAAEAGAHVLNTTHTPAPPLPTQACGWASRNGSRDPAGRVRARWAVRAPSARSQRRTDPVGTCGRGGGDGEVDSLRAAPLHPAVHLTTLTLSPHHPPLVQA